MTTAELALDDSQASGERIIGALGDEHARAILRAASNEPKTVAQLADYCGVAPTTIYRRIDELCDLGLLDEAYKTGTPGQPRTFQTCLGSLRVEIDDGEISAEVDG